MRLKVQKYGGSSVADPGKLRRVAKRVVESRQEGDSLVVVVSAMGDTTEQLLGLAQELSHSPSHRELDMLLSSGERISTALLAMAIEELGVEAISLTGAQSGIRTSGEHFRAHIEEIRPKRVLEELAKGKVVVVAGFQGASPHGETTTLGRGGSDTTAVALAGALEAESCEILSDVEGVFTADPRIVEEAQPLETIDYQEMLELARHGARVLNRNAVELARDLGVTLRAASTFSQAPGTIVTTRAADNREEPRVKGVACHRELIRFSMAPGANLQDEVLEAGGSPDVYLADVHVEGTGAGDSRHEVLVRSESVADEEALSSTLAREFGARVEVETGVGSVSAVGRGVGAVAGLESTITELSQRVGSVGGRHVLTDHALTFLVDGQVVEAATRALHGALVEPALVS